MSKVLLSGVEPVSEILVCCNPDNICDLYYRPLKQRLSFPLLIEGFTNLLMSAKENSRDSGYDLSTE